MNAYCCGRWDGVNLWTQWEDLDPETGYRLRVRHRPEGGDWQAWVAVGGERITRPWLVVPLWKQGAEVEAQVTIADGEEWHTLAEVTFSKSRCRFSIEAGAREAHYYAGDQILAIVDGAPCCYRFLEEILVPAGETAT